LTTAHFALDAVISYLELQGIARSLSSPSLTVLSGEIAQFQVGGDIPVSQSFVPTGANAGGAGIGVFNSVVFLDFGIRLNVRPLVGDDDSLTLDLLPMVSTPDPALTATIRNNTGTNPATTAFNTRSLRTSARLQDGQALLVGGLLSRTTNDQQFSTPGLRDVPGLGWLFRDFNQADDATELVVVVDPVIVRDPVPNVALWEFPDVSEMMQRFASTMFATRQGGGDLQSPRP
jgi:type II secretory pathway component GspD/PulD (secretin)